MSHREVWADLATFTLVVFLLSAGFYLVGPIIGSLSAVTRSNLPGAALIVVCPTLAAALCVGLRGGGCALLRRVTRRPAWSWWWLPTVFAVPALVLTASVWTANQAWDIVPWLNVTFLVLLFAVSAALEELGWTGYALPRLLQATGPLTAGLAFGVIWAVWHGLPYLQAGNSLPWTVGQMVFSVLFRVVLVTMSLRIGPTIWPAVAGHAAYNLAWTLSPGAGSHYDPWLVAALTAVYVIILEILTHKNARTDARRFVDNSRPA